MATTLTMERNILEVRKRLAAAFLFTKVLYSLLPFESTQPTTKEGFSFSSPYLYEGLQFFGIQPFVSCAEEHTLYGVCEQTRICVKSQTTHSDKIKELGFEQHRVVDTSSMWDHLLNGTCNVAAANHIEVGQFIREPGNVEHENRFVKGSKFHGTEPLSMVTRSGDDSWSNFVEMTLRALLGVTDSKFQRAVDYVGTIDQLYERHLAPIAQRNMRKETYENGGGTAGIMHSLPFGSLEPNDNDAVTAHSKRVRLTKIKKNGYLRCGVFLEEGFNEPTSKSLYGKCKAGLFRFVSTCF